MSFLSNVFHLSDLNLQNIGQCYIYTLNNNVAWGRISTNIAEILKKMDNSTFAEIYIQIAAKNRRDIPQLLTLFEKLTVIQKQSIQRNDKKVFFIILCKFFLKFNILFKIRYFSIKVINYVLAISMFVFFNHISNIPF